MVGRSYALVKDLMKRGFESLIESLLYLFIMYLSIMLFFIMNDIVTKKRTLTIAELNSYFPGNWIDWTVYLSIAVIVYYTTRIVLLLGGKLRGKSTFLSYLIPFLYLLLLFLGALLRVFPH